MTRLAGRLQRINRIALLAALVVVTGVIVVSSMAFGVSSLIDNTRVQAKVLAENAIAPLLFQDSQTAQELLQSLRSSPDVLRASLYAKDGKLFASYERDASAVRQNSAANPEQLVIGLTHVTVVQPVMVQQATSGNLMLVASLMSVYRHALWQILAATLGAALALLASNFLLLRLNASVIEPLTRLNEVTERVSHHADYSVRAGNNDIAELNVLATGFNTMLEQIQERDGRLALQRNHLEDQVELRTAELRNAKQVAEAGNTAKSEFLATMSHEIRTPMIGVLGMNELLMGSSLSAQQRVWVQTAQVSGRHLLAVINDVLDYSRVESGQMAIEQVRFSLQEVVQDAVAMSSHSAQAKGLSLSVEFNAPDAPFVLHGDPLRLRQVIANLVGNAVKFTHKGGVVVHVQVQESAGNETDDGEATVVIHVEDSGIGIEPAAQAHIFERFSQADGSTTRKYGGSGLGLAICQRLLTLMGGTIEVQSAPGMGSVFTVVLRLPMTRMTTIWPALSEFSALSDAGYTPDPSVAPLAGKVLLVEDNLVNQSVAKAMLKKLGLDYKVAANGFEAIECVQHFDFDLVLMDCQMPEMDGFEATAKIRRLPGQRGEKLPIVAMTANTHDDDRQRCLNAGMDAFLAKPYTLAALHATLLRWLVMEAVTVPQEIASADAGLPAIHPGVIADLQALDATGGNSLAVELFTAFLATADQFFAQLESAADADNGKILGQLAHSLKSSSAHVGALKLSGQYRQLEKLGREQKMQEARAMMAQVRHEHERAVSQIMDLRSQLI